MPKTRFPVVDEIPPIDRGGRGSKFDEVWEEAEKAAPKPIVVYDEDKVPEGEKAVTAANRAAYLRSIAPKGYSATQRGTKVFAFKES